MRFMDRRPGTTFRLALLALAGAAASAAAETPPPGVEQLMPRGGIPAIFEPRFVSAEEADIPPEAWVLGVAVDGKARAYSLNLLNSHEVVNDRIGEKSFDTFWYNWVAIQKDTELLR